MRKLLLFESNARMSIQMTNFVGSVVRLFLEEGQFEGTVVSVDANSKKLTLEKVVNCATGQRLYGLQRYYGREIKQVSVVKKSQEDLPRETETMNSEDVDNTDFTYVSQLDENFHEIVMKLREETTIGMEVISVDVDGRSLCIIEVSCNSKVFLFDVMKLGVSCIKQAFTEILESNQILKTDPSIWQERPLPVRLLCSAAKTVEYLPFLADAMHERYMQDLKRGFDVYLNVARVSNMPHPHKGHRIIPELSDVLHSKQTVTDKPSTVRHLNGASERAETNRNEEEDIDCNKESSDEERALRLRREHEAKWLDDTKSLRAQAVPTQTMTKRQETLHKHLEQLLKDHATDIRMDRERSPIGTQSNDSTTIEEQETESEGMEVAAACDVNPAYLYDPWSANPQVDREEQHPTYLNGTRREFEITTQDKSTERLVGWRWPTERQLQRMTRKGDQKPLGV